jgi:pyrimidine operon attenuation protein/uracil phosphoribosyltransferase
MSDQPAVAPSAAGERIQIMDATAIARAIRRIADEMIERNGPGDLARLAIVGIHTRGVELARRLTSMIEQIERVRPAFGVLDVSMHRDDLGRRQRLTSIQPTDLPIDLDAHAVVIVDDVFATGRTARAALDALGEFGRPARIQLAALVDRRQRELPIRPDYVGKVLATLPDERVQVRLAGQDGEPDAVWLLKAAQD